MKLNPPASSSDLEVARAIARRLHLRARGPEAAPGPMSAAAHPRSAERRPPTVTSRAPAGRLASAPAPPALEPELEPMPPGGYTADTGSFPPSAPEESEPSPFEPEPPGGYTTDSASLEPEPPAAPELFEPEPPGGYVADTGSFEPKLPGAALGALEEPSLEGAGSEFGAEQGEADDALSYLTGPGGESTFEGLEPPAGDGVSPEDLIPEGPGWSEPSPIEAEVALGDGGTTATEDLVEIPTPSWDDVADSCLALAPAHGAMLVDPAGQVLAARGDWPEPGPAAIAGRLVSMMEKKLRDAPTRSVSAPLAGQHLTAWRVPADDGYLTIVFMAAAPLRADVRPAIDATIQASAG